MSKPIAIHHSRHWNPSSHSPHAQSALAFRQPSSELSKLPSEILLAILSQMSLKTFSAFSLCCKQIQTLAQDNALWYTFFFRRFNWISSLEFSPKISYLDAFKQQHRFNLNLVNGVYASYLLKGHDGPILCIAIDKQRFFTGSFDKTIKVWDIQSKKCLKTLPGHTDSIFSLLVVGDRLISAAGDQTIKVWDLNTLQLQRTLTGHTAGVNYLLAEGDTLFSCSSDRSIKKWNIESGECLQTLAQHEGDVSCLALYKNKLFSGSEDYTIKMWDVETGHCLKTLTTDAGWVRCLAIANGKLYSASNQLMSWNAETGDPLETSQQYSSSFCSLAVAHQKLILSDQDGMIQIYETGRMKCLTSLKGENEIVSAFAFIQNQLISVSVDESIKILDFAASDVVIFEQILELLKSGNPKNVAEAMTRFSRMPDSVQGEVFSELCAILSSFLCGYSGSGEDAFYGTCGEMSLLEQKIQAIENYLSKKGLSILEKTNL